LGIAQGGFNTLLDNTSIPVPAPYAGGDIADNGFRPQLDNGDLPSTVAGGIGGSLSLVAGTGIAYQHGFRPQVDNANLPLPVAEGIGYQHRLQGSACLPLPIENPAGADPSDMSTPSQQANAQPEFAAGPTQQHSYPAHYEANGQVEEFNSLDAMTRLPTSASDGYIASRIRAIRDWYGLRDPSDIRDHVFQADPWDIRDERRLFIQWTRQEFSSLFWKEKHDDAIAIRGGPGQSQRYVATKRTYEFQGTKPDKKKKLFMNEYRLLDPHKDRPDERMYAVCHDCDRILSAPIRNGTSNLNRHHATHLQPSSS
jgi:hypothetical protein